MSERSVQLTFQMRNMSSYQIMMPNFTPPYWWECDLFSVTKAGYFVEHEIKVSRADFKADKKKAHSRLRQIARTDTRTGRGWERVETKKHDLLSEGSTKGPCRFWYVVPDGLVTPEEVPSFAGLIYFTPGRHPWACHLTIEKKAPQLHKKKIDHKVVEMARGASYHRYWNALRAIQEIRAEK